MQDVTMPNRIEPPRFPCLEMDPRILLGPGPSTVHPRVLQAMAGPVVGHLDPAFLQVMDRIQEMLRYVFQTQNPLTIPVSGSGSAAMEAAVANLRKEGIAKGVHDVGDVMFDVAISDELGTELIACLIGALLFGLIGFMAGRERAFTLRVQAQKALCQVKIEENTRKS